MENKRFLGGALDATRNRTVAYSNGAVQKETGKPSRQHMIVTTNSTTQRRVSHTAQNFWRSSEFLGFSPGRGVASMPRFHLHVLVGDLGFNATLAIEGKQVVGKHMTINIIA